MDRLTTLVTVGGTLIVALVALWGSEGRAELGPPMLVAQTAPTPAPAPTPTAVGGAQAPAAAGGGTQAPAAAVDPTANDKDYVYDPSGRRDPFIPLIQSGEARKRADQSLPPLQRVGLTEVTLIGIIWGGFGYTAMVQTPDGKGYAVRRGTRIGPNNGIVSKVTQNSIVVTERFTDIYGKDQEREYVKLLHPSEESE